MPHVAEWKKDEVASLKKLIESHEVVGMANLSDIPAPQLQKMRQNTQRQCNTQDVKENSYEPCIERL